METTHHPLRHPVFGDIYSRQARSTMLRSHTYSTGESPRTVHTARFEYANGLVADYNGNAWSVVTPERKGA